MPRREAWWNRRCRAAPCDSLTDFNMLVGHELPITEC
jgi:hypothetical protein